MANPCGAVLVLFLLLLPACSEADPHPRTDQGEISTCSSASSYVYLSEQRQVEKPSGATEQQIRIEALYVPPSLLEMSAAGMINPMVPPVDMEVVRDGETVWVRGTAGNWIPEGELSGSVAGVHADPRDISIPPPVLTPGHPIREALLDLLESRGGVPSEVGGQAATEYVLGRSLVGQLPDAPDFPSDWEVRWTVWLTPDGCDFLRVLQELDMPGVRATSDLVVEATNISDASIAVPPTD